MGRYVVGADLYRRAVDADGTSLCSAVQETLTVEGGVEVDLQGYDVRVEGGAVDVDGATVTGRWAYFYVDDRTVCGEVWHGRATVADASLSGVSLDARDAASLTVSDSVIRRTIGLVIRVRDDATLTITNSDFRGFSGNVIESTSSQVVVATGNYWGCSTGPNTEGCAGYTGNVQDDDWVASGIHETFRSISLELVDIHAYQDMGDDDITSLGALTLAMPVQVPKAATEVRIKFRVLDEGRLALPNETFNIGMDNGLLRASQGFENVTTDDNGFLVAKVEIASSFDESAAQLWLGLYADADDSADWGGWGPALAEFLSFFTTIDTLDVLPVGAVVAAEDVFTPEQLETVEAALAAAPRGYIDFADLASILPRGQARTALSGRVASAISDGLGGIVRGFGEAVGDAYDRSSSVVELIVPSERLRLMHDEGKIPSVAFTGEDWRNVSQLVADNGDHIWNGTKCVVLAASTGISGAGAAASHGVLAPAAAYLGSKTVVACAAFAVGVVADVARYAIEHAHCDGTITQDQYDLGIELLDAADGLSTILAGIEAIGGDPSSLLLGATHHVFGSQPSSECDGVVTDSYIEPSVAGASLMVTYESDDDDVQGTVAVPLSGEVVDSIMRPTYAGFGVLPRSGGLFEDDDLDCALNYAANGGSWRAANYLDIHDYIDRGGDYGTLSSFIRHQAGLSPTADRLCREEAMEDGDEFNDRLSQSGGWLGPSLKVVPAGTSGEGDDAVTFEDPFAIGRYEVTFADFDRYARATDAAFPDDAGGGRGARPVVNVSADEASVYARWLSLETGKVYRLATAQEWEYAANAGDSGDETAHHGNVSGAGVVGASPLAPERVGNDEANEWGLHDFRGNVREWLRDCADGESAKESRAYAPTVACRSRMIAGGSYLDAENRANTVDEAGMPSGTQADDVGFRVVQELTGFYPGTDTQPESAAAAAYIPDVEVMGLFETLDALND
ncbi:MAG: SUMF1/EgtB/PvdO family nonheme iron enzyme [Gammaproteobacteria bacterium]|nr:SUMF1/EgtB/PvdO family nonheme iron enzyme [Gammaproteobacteria bacterium]